MKERNIYEAVCIYVKMVCVVILKLPTKMRKLVPMKCSELIKSLNLVVIVCSVQTLTCIE